MVVMKYSVVCTVEFNHAAFMQRTKLRCILWGWRVGIWKSLHTIFCPDYFCVG